MGKNKNKKKALKRKQKLAKMTLEQRQIVKKRKTPKPKPNQRDGLMMVNSIYSKVECFNKLGQDCKGCYKVKKSTSIVSLTISTLNKPIFKKMAKYKLRHRCKQQIRRKHPIHTLHQTIQTRKYIFRAPCRRSSYKSVMCIVLLQCARDSQNNLIQGSKQKSLFWPRHPCKYCSTSKDYDCNYMSGYYKRNQRNVFK
jgi:hypothetical protein